MNNDTQNMDLSERTVPMTDAGAQQAPQPRPMQQQSPRPMQQRPMQQRPAQGSSASGILGAAASAVVAGGTGALGGAALGAGAVVLTSGTLHPDEHEVPHMDVSSVEAVVDENIHVAHVSDDLSFASAFAEARDQVGGHGVFEWHGKLYNTYTEEEWKQMSEAERSEFGRDIAQGDYGHAHHAEGVTTVVGSGDSESDVIAAVEGDNEDIEVEVLGMETILDDNGQEVTIGTISVDGDDVYVVDVDGDGQFDVMASDLDNDGSLAQNEMYDISDADLSISDLGCDIS